MNRRDVATGVAFFAFGLGAAWLTAALPDRSLPNTPGPAFFPWVVVVALLVLAAMLFARGLMAAPDGGSADEEISASRGSTIAMLGAFAIYLVLLPRLGFLIATAPFFAFLMVLYGERRPLFVAASAVAATVGLYVLFRHGFQIILPQGVLRGLVP